VRPLLMEADDDEAGAREGGGVNVSVEEEDACPLDSRLDGHGGQVERVGVEENQELKSCEENSGSRRYL
jgi:hypothetical protein